MLPEQICSEIKHLLELTDKIYSTFGLPFKFELSTRPEKSMGSDENWELATSSLKEALEDRGHSYRINAGDGAFYGPKIDLHIRDTLGRFWQCGTIQVDMSLPEKFNLEYIDRDGTRKRPIMLHRTIYGSLERFFGILIEHFGGKFPLWLSPYQIRILSVADRHNDYAHTLAKRLRKGGFVVDVDDSNESVGKKVRTAQLLKTNYILTVGDKELENKTAALRTRDNVVHGEVDISNFLAKVVEERDTRSLMSPYSLGA
jgi:threonyl-tRNA synthetase